MIRSNKLTTNRKQLVTGNALAIVSAYGLTTLHHIYGGLVDHAPNRLTAPVIMAVPTVAGLVALYRYERTGSKTALATAATVTSIAWVGLSGLLHGGYAHAFHMDRAGHWCVTPDW
jgi:membrane protease YdiL (CAAX protease family)